MTDKNFDCMEQPSWYDGKMIDEVAFCVSFLHQHPMKCVRGRLFTVDGMIEDEGKIQQMILDEDMTCQSIGIAKKIKSLFDAVKLMAYSDPLPIETDRIHVANGTYFLDGTFTEDKTYCNNRMKVNYNPNAPQPQRWLHFLSDLLVPEDIPTLQEYLGYCLIPSTKGQKMLMLIGKGGEVKSRIGLVMRSILGDTAALKPTTSAPRKNTQAIPILTLPVHTSISTSSSRNASIEQNPKSRSEKQAAAHAPTAFVWWKLLLLQHRSSLRGKNVPK